MKLFESNKPSQFANRFAKRGFLTGAAALSMMEALEGRHAANLARLGYELKDEGRRIATPNTSVTLDPNQVPAVLTPGVGTVQDRQPALYGIPSPWPPTQLSRRLPRCSISRLPIAGRTSPT